MNSPSLDRYFTPLRYPGGKAKLAPYVKAILEKNELLDGHYAEAYAGGAAVAMELLLHEYVSHIHINDISKPLYQFWTSVLNRTDEVSRKIHDTYFSVPMITMTSKSALRFSFSIVLIGPASCGQALLVVATNQANGRLTRDTILRS